MVSKLATPEEVKCFVLQKLYFLKLDKADFVKTRWLFEWNETKAPVDNVPGATQELEILNDLALEGVIGLTKVRNETHLGIGKPPKYKYRDITDYAISQHKFYKPETDKAYMGFDWCAWITSLDYQKFLATCKDAGFEPATGVSEATIKLEGFNTPVVTINGKDYTMKPLRSSAKPEVILDYCINDKASNTVTIRDLIAADIIKSKVNLNQVFAKTQFGRAGILRPFITVRPDSIKLVRQAMLNVEQQTKIIAAATNN